MPKRGFRFVADVLQDKASRAESQSGAYDYKTSDSWSPHQSVHFCTTSDGVQIAYATVGAGPPLVKAANWLNHLEYDWQSPVWRHLFPDSPDGSGESRLFRALAKDRPHVVIPGRVTSGATEGEIGLWRPRRGLEHVGRDAIGAGDGAVNVGFALPCFFGRGPD